MSEPKKSTTPRKAKPKNAVKPAAVPAAQPAQTCTDISQGYIGTTRKGIAAIDRVFGTNRLNAYDAMLKKQAAAKGQCVRDGDKIRDLIKKHTP